MNQTSALYHFLTASARGGLRYNVMCGGDTKKIGILSAERRILHSFRCLCRGEGVAFAKQIMVSFVAKEVCQWQVNVGIAVVRAMAIAVSTVRTRFTNTATTRSTASGAAAQAMGAVAYTPLTRYTGTAQARTSASGAARRQTAQAASIRRLTATRSKELLRTEPSDTLARGGFAAKCKACRR